MWLLKKCLMSLTLILSLIYLEPTSVASSLQYSKDLDQYLALILKVHPDPFRYRSEQDFLVAVQQLRQRIIQQTIADEHQFLAALATLNASLACAHTKILPGAGVLASFINRPSVFPIPVKIVGKQLMVDSDQYSELPFGSEIIRIDGEPAAGLLQNLRDLVASDAYQVEYMDRRIEESFAFYLGVIKGPQTRFMVQIQTPTGQNSEHKIKAERLISRQEYADRKKTRQVFQHSNSPIQLTIMKDKKLAFLRVQTFLAVPNEFSRQIEQAFRKIIEAKIEALILDLRGNEGGLMDNALSLAAHVLPADIKPNLTGSVRSLGIDIHQGLYTVNGKPMQAQIEEQLTSYLKDNFGEQIFEGLYQNKTGFALNKTVPRATPNFRHDVILLQDGGTASSALYFARLFRDEKRGMILGEAAGGRGDGFHGHILLRYQLEYSQTFVEIPLVKIDFPKPSEKSSSVFLLPDQIIPANLNTWRELTDQAALAAIRFWDHVDESDFPAPQKQ